MTQPKIDHQEAVRPDSIMPATVTGVPCYAFTVRAGDVQPWDAANIGPNGKPNERAEISYAPAPGPQKVNSPYNVRDSTGKQTYDVDYRFKAGWPTHDPAQHQWAVLTQFHPQDDNPGGFHGFGGVTVHGNEITLDTPDGQSYFARETIKPDTWYRRRLAMNWSSKADGYAKWIDRGTGQLLGRYDGPTIAAGEFKYLKQGYYRAGGLPEGTVYQTLIDINPGDLSMATTTTPTQTPPTTTATPAAFDASKPSVNPNAGAQQLMATRDALQAQITAINALLNQGGYKP